MLLECKQATIVDHRFIAWLIGIFLFWWNAQYIPVPRTLVSRGDGTSLTSHKWVMLSAVFSNRNFPQDCGKQLTALTTGRKFKSDWVTTDFATVWILSVFTKGPCVKILVSSVVLSRHVGNFCEWGLPRSLRSLGACLLLPSCLNVNNLLCQTLLLWCTPLPPAQGHWGHRLWNGASKTLTLK